MKNSSSAIEQATTKARKPIASLCALALALSVGSCGILAGCSSESSTSSNKTPVDASDPNIDIVSTGFSTAYADKIEFGFSATNKQEGQLARNVLFAVEAYNSDDQALAGTSATISALYPNVETYSAGSMDYYDLSVTQATAEPAEDAAAAEAAEGEETTAVATGAATVTNTTISYLKVTLMPSSVEWTSTDVKADQIENVIKTGDVEVFTVNTDLTFNSTYTVPENSVFAGNEIRAQVVVFNADGEPIAGSDPMYLPGEDGDFTIWLFDSPGFEDYKIYFTPVE